MKMTIEGPLNLEEVSRIHRLIQEMDRGRTDRVVSMFIDEPADLFESVEHYLAWAEEMGMRYGYIATAPTEVSFEAGGGLRVMPIQPGEKSSSERG